MASKANRLRTESKEEKTPQESVSSSFSDRLRSFTELIRSEKAKQVAGLVLLLSSVYILIALASFLVTGMTDQDKFNNVSAFRFLLSGNQVHVENWLGKIGALVSHLLIHQGFGVASFLFSPLCFLAGFRILFKVSLLPLRKTFLYSIISMLWMSSTLAYIFHSNYFFLGGGFGYHINQTLYGLVGYVGMGFLLAFIAMVFSVSVFNISFSRKATETLAEPEADENQLSENPGDTEPVAENTVDLTETPVAESKGVEMTVESILPKTDEFFETPVLEEEEEEEIEAEVPVEKNKSVVAGLDFDVEVPKEVESLSESEIKAPDEAYDPTLELSSYKFPVIDLLEQYGSNKIQVNKEELEANKNKIVETLRHYNIEIDKIKAIIGPTVTLYEIIPAAGVRISKIKNLEDDIALSLAALGIRIIAPIPGKGTIGIEVPNQKPEVVSMHSIISSERFQNSEFDLPIGIGKTISNDVFIADLAKMPHLLMAGSTGQGKSVGLNAVLVSLLYKKHPSQIKFVLVDPKKVELTLYKKIERHFLAKLPGDGDAIITDVKKVVHTLNSLCIEMDLRYDLLKDAEVRNIKEYNAKFLSRKLLPTKGHRYLPYIVLVVDEFADLIMVAGKEVEAPIARIAQLARAIGIHLIIATQRPSVNIITGTIKANFPARIAFRVASKIDSRTILDAGGADQLIGRGDMLFSTGAELIRLQCAFVDTPEVEKVTEFIGSQRGYPDAHMLPEYVEESTEGGGGDLSDADKDPLFEEAARMVVQHQQGSASLLQRRLKLGYNRAGRIIDQLEAFGIIGPFEGSKAREVLVKDPASLDQLLEKSKSE